MSKLQLDADSTSCVNSGWNLPIRVPTFTMTVKAGRIAYVQFSGPREGEYLVADEVRFAPLGSEGN